jgi:hypothetical protein
LSETLVKGRRNVIIDTTLSNPDPIIEKISELKKTHQVEIRAVASHWLESELGVDKRFTEQLAKKGFGRYVPAEFRNFSYNALPGSLDKVHEKTGVQIRIFNREGQELYNSHTSPMKPGAALEQAREARMKDPAVTRAIAKDWVKQQDVHKNLPESLKNNPRVTSEAAQNLLNERQKLGAAQSVTENARKAVEIDHGVRSIAQLPKAPAVAAGAFAVYELADTGHKVFRLRSQGNETGVDSAIAHFGYRNVSALAGVAAGAYIGSKSGFLAGSPTGLGAAVTTAVGGVVGGVVGGFIGGKMAQQSDIERVYTQTSSSGVEYRRDPDDPKGAWISDGRFEAAHPDLIRELNYKMAKASYELGLANPPAPRDPYSIPDKDEGLGRMPLDWKRNEKGEWSREILVARSDGAWATELQRAPPEQVKALEAQSQLIVAENASNTPASIAARFQVAYNGSGWKSVGPVPESIKNAAQSIDTLQASNGNDYTRNADGEWIHDGVIYNSKAGGNIRNELNAVYESQKAGLAEMGAQAKLAAVQHISEKIAEDQKQQFMDRERERIINESKNHLLNQGYEPKSTQEQQTPSPSSSPAPHSQTKAWNGVFPSVQEYRAQKVAQAEQNYDKHLNAFMEASPKVAAQLETHVQQTGETLRVASQQLLFPNGKGDQNLLLDKYQEAIPLIKANKELNESMRLVNQNAPRPEVERNTAPGLG